VILFWRRKASFGQRGEDLAARHLRRNGYRILERNVRLAGCEIDIIAREGDTVAFVEVKTRRSDDHTAPEDSVGATKQRHIQRAAELYCKHHPEPGTYYRFDVVSVLLPDEGKPTITLLRNAFPAK
jgi:putative endonuclease